MTFKAKHLALTLPKGYAKEYKDRQLFDSIYFSKLSMLHEQEGYIPILYNFQIEHQETNNNEVPDSILMTFYYPEKKRMSNLNGIIVIGGRPNIYDAYQTTKMITPYLESLTLSKHDLKHSRTVAIIDETLRQLAEPTSLRDVEDIIERSQGKSGEDLTTFFPFLEDDDYSTTKLALPNSFQVDAVFMIGITDEFFTSTEIGSGIHNLKVYAQDDHDVDPSLAFSLIFKWQPIYNDILNQLKKDQEILPWGYEGKLLPSVIMFQHQHDDQITALISSIEEYNGKLYYHVAMANSGYSSGQPLTLLQAALKREKFGKEKWINKLDNLNFIPEDSIKDQEYADDLISTQLNLVVPETDLTSNGVFDLGKLRSIQV